MKSLFLLFFVGATSFINAQTKTAHIDTQALVEIMPEMNAAQGQLKKLEQTYDTALKDMAKEFEAKVKMYGSEETTKTQAENATRVEEVQGMERNIGAYRQQAIQDMEKKRIDLYQPVLEKARLAIQKVARAKGYQYVLDSATGNGVILADGFDLFADVKKELGM